MSQSPTAFVDRDGVINRKRPEGEYVNSRDEFEPLPGSIEALAALSRAGYIIVIVTNQQGVAKGVTDSSFVDGLHMELVDLVAAAGGTIDQVQICSHLAGTCECRKPAVGLFEQARAKDPRIDFARSVVIGDSQSDIEAALQIGARPVLVTADAGATLRTDGVTEVADLAAAAEMLTDVASV